MLSHRISIVNRVTGNLKDCRTFIYNVILQTWVVILPLFNCSPTDTSKAKDGHFPCSGVEISLNCFAL